MSWSNVKQWAGTIAANSVKGDEVEMMVSTGTLDRQNDRVIPSGADFSGFMRNPILLWGHDYSQIPIGAVTGVDAGPSGIRARWKWNEQDELGTRVKRAWDGGFVRGASIGFQPLEFERNPEGGLDYTKWSLLEISLVPVPANAEAVRAFKNLKLWPEKTGKGGLDVDWGGYREWLGVSTPDTRTRAQRDFDIMMGVRRVLIQRAQNWPAGGEPMPWPAPRDLDAVPPDCRSFQPIGPVRAHGPNLIEFNQCDLDAVLAKVRRTLQDEVAKAKPLIDRAINRVRGRID